MKQLFLFIALMCFQQTIAETIVHAKELNNGSCYYEVIDKSSANWKRGVKNAEGRLIVPVEYDYIYTDDFTSEERGFFLRCVMNDGRKALYYSNGENIIPLSYGFTKIKPIAYVEEKGNGTYYMAGKAQKLYLLNVSGTICKSFDIPISLSNTADSSQPYYYIAEYFNYKDKSLIKILSWDENDSEKAYIIFGNNECIVLNAQQTSLLANASSSNTNLTDEGLMVDKSIVIPYSQIPVSLNYLSNNLNLDAWTAQGCPKITSPSAPLINAEQSHKTSNKKNLLFKNISEEFYEYTQELFSHPKSYSMEGFGVTMAGPKGITTYKEGESYLTIKSDGYFTHFKDGSGESKRIISPLEDITIITSDGDITIKAYLLDNEEAVRAIRFKDGHCMVHTYVLNKSTGKYIHISWYNLRK